MRLQQFIQRFCRDTRGNVMLLMGLGITTLVAAGGVGFDLGIQQITRSKLQQALDASSMAAGTVPADPDPDVDAQNRRNAAINYYNINILRRISDLRARYRR